MKDEERQWCHEINPPRSHLRTFSWFAGVLLVGGKEKHLLISDFNNHLARNLEGFRLAYVRK